MRGRLRRRDSDQAAEETGRLESELEQLRVLTDNALTKAEQAVGRIAKIAKETRA